MTLTALDLFAGSGWGVACRRLGIVEYGVEIMPEAVATRDAAGFSTIFRDVWDGLLPETFLSEEAVAVLRHYDILIASPPCQTFSVSGKGAGRRALDEVLAAIARGEYVDPRALRALANTLDPRTALVLTPLSYIYLDRPTFVALEQVPAVLPVWEAYAEVMREWGYSVAVGNVNAEQYGVPQTRKRAILVARRDGVEARLPAPTHSRYHARDTQRLDEGVLPWVSMAEALGWPSDDRVGFPRRDDGRPDGAVTIDGVDYRARDLRPASDPAQTITEKARSWQRLPAWTFSRPAPTVAGDPRVAPPGCKHPAAGCCSQNRDGHLRGRQFPAGTIRLSAAEAAALQTYPDGFPFQGSQTNTFLQIGNAVPPLLAEAILTELTRTDHV